jgi:hypothetical protein
MQYGLTRNTLALIVLTALSLALGLWLAYRWWGSRQWGGGGYRSRDY